MESLFKKNMLFHSRIVDVYMEITKSKKGINIYYNKKTKNVRT